MLCLFEHINKGEIILPLVITAIGVIILLILIMKFNLNTFISLIVVSFIIALLLGMPINEIVGTIEAGMGGTLGGIALVFGLVAILGKLIADAGGAQRIAKIGRASCRERGWGAGGGGGWEGKK